MKCVSKKFGVFEPDGFLDVTGFAFTKFDDHGVERMFCLQDISFIPVDELVRGRIVYD